jgi:hypothetical protein
MKPNNLSLEKGLSLSQAQSISNLCEQRAADLERMFKAFNNCSKTVTVQGKEFEIQQSNPIPKNIIDLITEKAKLHGCQAFLMENIKAKDAMLIYWKLTDAEVSFELPELPIKQVAVKIPAVSEEYGWTQLTATELNEYLEAEAYASHIGQFIHSKSPLDRLRTELSILPTVDWMVIEDKTKTPIVIKKHHESKDLLELHEELATLHRAFEQRVNYFKAKVKNITTEKNSAIAKLNTEAQNLISQANKDASAAHEAAVRVVNENVKSAVAAFEQVRYAAIQKIAKYRIQIDPRFQDTIDMFMKRLPDETLEVEIPN